MILAVIFDLDGVMIDSEAIHSQTFEQIVREYGKTPILHSLGVIQEPGLREKENWEQIMAKHNFSEDIGVLTKRRNKTVSDLLKKNAKMQEGLRSLLNSLKRKGIKMAVASSTSMQTISLVLNILKVSHYFDAVVSGDGVVRGKTYFSKPHDS